MSEATIVFQGKSKKGRQFIIRYPTMNDAEKMMNYINEVSHERTFISFQGEQMSLDEEKKYLQHQLEKVTKQQGVILLVMEKDKILGTH